jgi:hypothetical protein
MFRGKGAKHFHLEILLRLADPDAVILRESLQEVNTLVEDTIPRVTVFVPKRRISVGSLLLEQLRFRVLAAKKGHQSEIITGATSGNRAPSGFDPVGEAEESVVNEGGIGTPAVTIDQVKMKEAAPSRRSRLFTRNEKLRAEARVASAEMAVNGTCARSVNLAGLWARPYCERDVALARIAALTELCNGRLGEP